MKKNAWITVQLIQFVIFLCVTLFLFTRNVDGHGAIQTTKAKWISFGVWAVVYIVVLAVEWIIHLIRIKNQCKK